MAVAQSPHAAGEETVPEQGEGSIRRIAIIFAAALAAVGTAQAETIDDTPFVQSAVRAYRVPAQKQWWQYRWRVWLPDKWQRLGACETGYGRRPGNWDHANSSYVSAFGISRQAYDEDAAVMGAPPWNDRVHPTPWAQYRAALGHYKLHNGFAGWGCRNA